MAPSLTSNYSFRLTANPRSMPFSNKKIPKRTALVFCKQKKSSPFPSFPASLRIGKRAAAADEQEEAESDDGSNKAGNRFSFNLGEKAKSLIPAGLGSSSSTALFFSNQRRKDPRTVFVAGATGQAGVRIAQTLLRQGFTVRAGVPELASAQQLARLAAKYRILSPDALKRLNAVESSLEDAAESIAKAIGNATKVVLTIGPADNDEATINDALQVIRAAQLAGVGHVAVVYDDSGPPESTYNVNGVLGGITSFFTNLLSRSQPLTLAEFLSKLVETDVSYTVIKASLTDDFAPENSHGLVVSKEGTTADYTKVSKLQIASLVADVFANISIAENKVVEVSTNPSVPSKPIIELFSAIPEDGRRKAYEEALAKKKAEEEAIRASEKAREATLAAKKLEEEVKKLSEQEAQASSLAEEARQKAEEAGSSLEGLLSKAKDFSGEFSWQTLSSQFATAVSPKNKDEQKTQIATIRGQTKARTLPPQKAVIKQQLTPRLKPNAKQPEQKPEVRNVFGGLFKQETIYMDDD